MATLAMLVRYLSNIASILAQSVAGGVGEAVVGGEDDKFSLFHVVWCGAIAGGSPVNPIGCGGGGIRPPYHINVVPRKMLKEKVANFL